MTRSKLQDILDHAARLFHEHGYHKTKMEDIAKAVGIEKGTLYHYFNKKEELLYEITKEPLRMMIERARQIQAGAGSADSKLHKAIRNHIVMFITNRYPSLFVISQERIMELPETFRDEIGQMEREYQLLWEEIIRQGIREDTFEDNLSPRLTGFAILGLCNYMYKWHRPDGAKGPEEIADLFSQIILNGVCKRQGSAAHSLLP